MDSHNALEVVLLAYVAESLVERFQVELEGVFCASADVNGNARNASINAHAVNDEFTMDFTVGSDGNPLDPNVGSNKWD